MRDARSPIDGIISPFGVLMGSAFSPTSLFSSGAQGVWFDPSDLTTMFTDRARTIPVTAPGQTVGLRLDKSKGLVLGSVSTASSWTNSANAWDVFSSTGGAFTAEKTTGGGTDLAYSNTFPFVLGNWYEVTINVASTTLFSYNVTFSATTNGRSTTATFSGAGVKTALIQANVSSGNFSLAVSTTFNGSISVTSVSVRELPGNHATAPTDTARLTYGVEPKTGRRNLLLATDTLATQSLTVTAVAHTLAFTGTGTVTLTGASTAGPLVGTGAGNRVSLTFTPTAASLTLTVTGSVTLGQLERNSTSTNYQRVTTAYDVTESGVDTCHYCQYDGSDDSMSTAAIDFTATDKMSVFAGVRKLGSSIGLIAELSANADSNVGVFSLVSDALAASQYFTKAVGNPAGGGYQSTASPYASPHSAVIASLLDIAGSTLADKVTLRVNATASTSRILSSAGTGNFGNHPVFFGRRGSSSLSFSGKDYGIIIVGKTTSAAEITATEAYLAANTSGVSL